MMIDMPKRRPRATGWIILAAFWALQSLNWTQGAHAQEDPKQTVMVIAKGACIRFTIAGRKYRCDGVIYTHFSSGRTAWNIALPDGALMLSGATDSQLDPTRYILKIDRLRAARGDGSSKAYPATGRCTARVSVDGSIMHSLSCRATNGIEPVVVDFKGNGEPISRTLVPR